MPLVWAHAEHIKLLRSLRDGRVFDMPSQTVKRYIVEKVRTHLSVWRFNHKIESLPSARKLRVEVLAPSVIWWTTDSWNSSKDMDTRDSGLGIHFADLQTDGLRSGQQIEFTFFWPQAKKWEGKNFSVKIE
jgi:glucoamylase